MKMVRLSPPHYTLWNEIKASIGRDPGVTVNPLDTSSSPFIVPIDVADHDKAVAIASIMTLLHQLGNIRVEVQVKDGEANPVFPEVPESVQQLANMVEKALGDNDWFVKVVTKPLVPKSSRIIVFAVFQKAVIQFFNDDLSDLYHNYNNVVAFVFSDVLNPAPGGFSLYCSTDKDR
jgi:hypothetical protein